MMCDMYIRFCDFLWMHSGQDLEGMYVFMLACCGFGCTMTGHMTLAITVSVCHCVGLSSSRWH